MHVTRYGFNADGQPTTVTLADVGVTTSTFDRAGNLASSTDALNQQTSFTYDTRHLQRTSTDPLLQVTSTGYDLAGKAVTVQDANLHTTIYGYDADQRMITETRTDGSVVGTGYDADGNTISQTDGLGHATGYGYDAAGRESSSTDPLGRRTSFGYDRSGNQVSKTDPPVAGSTVATTTTTTYDVFNRPVTVAYSDVTMHSVAYTYDLNGRRLTMSDATGTSAYGYDNAGRLTSSRNGAGALLGYGYDAAANLTTITYPGGLNTVTRSFDAANRMATVTDWLGHTTTVHNDASGALSSEQYPNGVTATVTRDATSKITHLTDSTSAGVSLLDLAYGRDATGAATSATGTGAGQPQDQYAYDVNSRLSGLNSASFSYDRGDNLTTLVSDRTTAPTAMTYDVANQALTATTAGVVTTTAYDARGNRVSAATPGVATTTMSYDGAGRLVRVVNAAGTGNYSYDGDGLRQGKTTQAAAGPLLTTPFAWDVADGLPLLLTEGNTCYVYGPGGLPLERISGTTVLYYHQDQIGSTRLLTDASGTVVQSYAYDPYGATITSTGSVVNALRFAGEYQDTETGFVYLRARIYDPATAQFLTLDPLVALTRSPYGYVAGNPLNLTDPSGLLFGVSCDWCGKAAHTVGDAGSSAAGTVGQAAGSAWNATGGQVVNNVQNFASSSHTLGVCANVGGGGFGFAASAQFCPTVRFQGFSPAGFGTTETATAGAGVGFGVTGTVDVQVSNAKKISSLGVNRPGFDRDSVVWSSVRSVA